MSEMIKVVLVEDHQIVREGLYAMLASQDDIEVVGEASDGREALQVVAEHSPDLVVMDLNMPKLNGVDAIAQLRKISPSTHVLVLSMHGGEEYVRPAIRAGASGYLLKGAGLSELVKAIRAVLDGQAFFSPAVSKILLRDALAAEPGTEDNTQESLSPREREVLQLLAEGFSSPQIAKQLCISTKTVEAHRSRMMKKLDIHNIAGLVRYAIRIGLISLDS